MASRHDRPQDKPQAQKKHPDEWERDLNPSRMAGQNIGEHRELDEPGVRSAAEVHEAAAILQELTLEQLRDIPVLPPGARLEQGATYMDLRDPARQPFTAKGGMFAPQGSLLVPKAGVPHQTWNRILGEENPARIF